MTPAICELTDAGDFAALEPLIAEYLAMISDTLVTNHQVTVDMAGPLAATMSTPGKYVTPLGRTFLAEKDGDFVGMGVLKLMTGMNYEIKRLYVRAGARHGPWEHTVVPHHGCGM